MALVPFRLLAVLAHPEDDALICRQSLHRYADAGVETTMLWAAARDAASAGAMAGARAAGARDLLTLDFSRGELTGLDPGVLSSVIADIYRSVAPHVVVTFGAEGMDGDPDHVAVHHAAGRAFRTERRRARGSGEPPLRLYHAVRDDPVGRLGATTVVAAGAGRELFTRAYPHPWVTGVIEGDLFSGLPQPSADLSLERRAA